jgi:ABC-type nitrate/sulfonate/bicarbonate transport system ATPase subunit
MLQLNKVSKRFAGRTVIESASFSVAAGEVLCITGESGIGKSTLLEIIAGIIKPDSGSISRGGKISLCFQDNALIPWLSAAANLDYALPETVFASERMELINYWLARFGLAGDVLPKVMSSGMQRRLNLARAFAVNRPILLLDEPFAFLDSAWQEVVARCTAEAAQAGATVVLTSHGVEPLRELKVSYLHAASSPLIIEGGKAA